MAIMFGVSLTAVLLLAGVAWLLGLGKAVRIDDDEARGAAEHALSGFAAARALVAADGACALVLATDGRLAVVKRHGARPAVRLVSWSAVRTTPAGLAIDTGERRFGVVNVAGVDARAVRRALAG